MQNDENRLNVLLVQYCPSFKDIDASIKKLEQLLSKFNKSHLIDIIVLPEMALTGYNFDCKEEIKDCLEEYNKGKTYEFCANLSRSLKCYVFCGFPEICVEEGKEVYYNSCLITDREGNSQPSYKKTFLYETDKSWSVEGKGFGLLNIKSNSGRDVKLGIGICMDLNPYEFTAPFEKMEFSTFCKENDVECIVFLTNWLDNNPKDNTEKAVFESLNYWCLRCSPLLESDKNVYFLAADRCGKEKGVDFIGCSCVMKLSKNPRVLKNLDKKEENTIYYCLNLDNKTNKN